MKIVVLAGGLSPERDVSLSSGSLIANALIENGHDVILLDLYLGVPKHQHTKEFLNNKSKERYSYSVPAIEPDLVKLKAESGNGERLIGAGVIELCQLADVVFLALHGSIGENGQLQAVLDAYGIKYTGTGYVGSLLAMDKDISKNLMRSVGIGTANWKLYHINQPNSFDLSNITYPLVVKPCSCGSSVGVTMVENKLELENAIKAASLYEDMILLEDKIIGREFSIGILGDTALPIIEIIPKTGFYDYKNKYQAGLTSEICPANLDTDLTNKLQQAALLVHKTLRLGYYSRVDFILSKENEIFCLEANTLPGMTPTSLLPQEALVLGISYEDLCEKIALSALENII